MVVGTLYTNKDNFRAFKAQIAANYSGKKVDLDSGFTADKLPLGKVPGLETKAGILNESHAIAYFVANEALRGGDDELARAQVLEWMNFADTDFLPTIFNHAFPILGLMPELKDQGRNEQELHGHLGTLNKHLQKRTYFVGESVTLADICLACNLLLLFERGLLAGDRDKFPHLMRWFMTIVNQKNVKEVVGVVKLCSKLEPLPNVDDSAVVKNSKGLPACTNPGFSCFGWFCLSSP